MAARDTQFSGFAKLLMEELLTHFGDFEDMERIIAQRAYDLVEHVYGFQCFDHIDFAVRNTPDLTELPKDNP